MAQGRWWWDEASVPQAQRGKAMGPLQSSGKAVPAPADVCADIGEKLCSQDRHSRERGREGGKELHLDLDE